MNNYFARPLNKNALYYYIFDYFKCAYYDGAMYVIDPHALEKAMADNGYPTLQALADAMGVHRNTLHYYLKGQSIFPKAINDLLDRLNLSPAQAIRKKAVARHRVWSAIAPIVDRLTKEFPAVAWVMFGSRARGDERKYSDWDLGVFAKKGIEHRQYVNMRVRLAELMEATAYLADLTNLSVADREFYDTVASDLAYLGGSFTEWLALQERIESNEIGEKI